MPRLNKKDRIAKEEHKVQLIAEYKVFRGLCAFFGLNLEEMYFHLNKRSRLKKYYGTLGAFTIACSQRPTAIMNKEELRNGILFMKTELREDVFKAMNKEETFEELQKKWQLNG